MSSLEKVDKKPHSIFFGVAPKGPIPFLEDVRRRILGEAYIRDNYLSFDNSPTGMALGAVISFYRFTFRCPWINIGCKPIVDNDCHGLGVQILKYFRIVVTDEGIVIVKGPDEYSNLLQDIKGSNAAREVRFDYIAKTTKPRLDKASEGQITALLRTARRYFEQCEIGVDTVEVGGIYGWDVNFKKPKWDIDLIRRARRVTTGYGSHKDIKKRLPQEGSSEIIELMTERAA